MTDRGGQGRAGEAGAGGGGGRGRPARGQVPPRPPGRGRPSGRRVPPPARPRRPGAGRPAKLYRRAGRDLAVSLPERRYDLIAHVLAEAFDAATDGLNVHLVEGLVEALDEDSLQTRLDPAPGRCCATVREVA